MKYLIRINYKSGHSEEHWFESFSYKINGGDRDFKWKLANNKEKILFMNVGDIESIYQIDAKRA